MKGQQCTTDIWPSREQKFLSGEQKHYLKKKQTKTFKSDVLNQQAGILDLNTNKISNRLKK